MAFKKRKLYIWVVLIVIIIIIGFFVVNKNKKKPVQYLTSIAELKQLTQTVGETGTVKSRNDVNLNFATGGQITKINTKVGDKVIAGQILAELDHTAISNKEKEVAASVAVAKASLDKLLSGSTNQDILISNKSLEQAKISYDAAIRDFDKVNKSNSENLKQAEKRVNDLTNKTDNYTTANEQAISVASKNLENTKKTSQATIDNSEESNLTVIEDKISVCNVALDNIFKIIDDRDIKDFLSVKYPAYASNAKSSYNSGVILLTTAQNTLEKAKTDHSLITQSNTDILNALNATLNSLTNTYKSLENSITTIQFTQTEMDTYKTLVNTHTNLVNSAISSVKNADTNLSNSKISYTSNVSLSEENLAQAKANYNDAVVAAKNTLSSVKINNDRDLNSAQARVDSAKSSWEVAKAQNGKVISGANIHDIDLSQAQYKQAQASLDSVRKQIDDSVIKSPINGIVTKVNYTVGEQISSANPVITLLTENNFNVEVDISESDIEKISIGNKVSITLDAFGEDEKLTGVVSFIDPAETVIQEVIYYKLKIDFSQDDLSNLKQKGKMIKSGMTANTTITTAEKNNTLVVPIRAILEKDGKKIIRVLTNNNPDEKVITSGLQGDGGLVEIISGIQNGDVVVTSIKEN